MASEYYNKRNDDVDTLGDGSIGIENIYLDNYDNNINFRTITDYSSSINHHNNYKNDGVSSSNDNSTNYGNASLRGASYSNDDIVNNINTSRNISSLNLTSSNVNAIVEKDTENANIKSTSSTAIVTSNNDNTTSLSSSLGNSNLTDSTANTTASPTTAPENARNRGSTLVNDNDHHANKVIIVGNGPSAIALSFMLSGWRPYYNGLPLSNEFLMKRLEENAHQSLMDKDLEPLCEGLEGRSNNPVALLFDHLHHPDADLGSDNPSVLDWVYQADYAIPHIVLGNSKPGGTWQKIDGSMQTISQSSWMELPTLPFNKWLEDSNRLSETLDPTSDRATIKDVKDYYTDFVKTRQLDAHFKNFSTVTSIQNIFHGKNIIDDESGEVLPCCRNVRRNHTHCWEVRGYKTTTTNMTEDDGDTNANVDSTVGRQEFSYRAPYVVVATGTYDVPNRLEVDGENLANVVHSLGEFEKQISSGLVSSLSDPVVVVGAGLSAADCILMALQNNIPVIHVFRRGPFDPSLIFSKLPAAMYPEYHHIHSLMKGKAESDLYRPLPRHSVVEIMPGKILVKKSQRNAKPMVAHFDISLAAIMIGSKSDLGFLPEEGRHLGVVSKWPIDSKHNVMDVNSYSYQCNKEPQLFAMGPLVGDNFVRFGVGGALGIVNHLNRCQQSDL